MQQFTKHVFAYMWWIWALHLFTWLLTIFLLAARKLHFWGPVLIALWAATFTLQTWLTDVAHNLVDGNSLLVVLVCNRWSCWGYDYQRALFASGIMTSLIDALLILAVGYAGQEDLAHRIRLKAGSSAYADSGEAGMGTAQQRLKQGVPPSQAPQAVPTSDPAAVLV